jgi:hypothetical protein
MMNKKVCFVLMPFAEKYREVYEQVYKPACDHQGLKCWRVDEISRPGSITQDIVEGIIDADIIIADLTTQNPNVFYELGISHSIGNKTIMTSQSIDYVPFDISNYRVIIYEQSIAGSKILEKRIIKAIDELLVVLDRTNNPVQSALGKRTAMYYGRKIPLFKAVDISLLTSAFHKMIKDHNIIYIEDLSEIIIEELIRKPGFGKTSVSQLVHLMISYDLYSDAKEFYRIIKKYKIKVTDSPDPYSKNKWLAFMESVKLSKKAI